MEDRLLERILVWKNEPSRRDRVDDRRKIDSILAHLTRLLNTRQGNVPISERYGIPDLTDLMISYPESVMEIERAIQSAIETYEPRLRFVKIALIPQEDDLLRLRFQIIARLDTHPGKDIFIETLVDPDGRIRINGF
jgi:type VI secretion system protein